MIIHKTCAIVQLMAKSKEIVVDASVVLAVILNAPEKEGIIECTEGRDLASPGCLKWEIGNAFSAMLKRKRLNKIQVQQALDTFLAIPIKEVEVNLNEALKICGSWNIYAYDAYYMVVSKRLSRPMLTLDNRMAEVAKQEGIEVEEI